MAVEPGNRLDRARNLRLLGSTQVIRDSVSQNDKIDFFRFRVNSRRSFQSGVNRLKSDIDFTLFNSDRQRIAASRNSGTQSEAIGAVLDPGIYFLKINRKSRDTNYRLRLSAELLAAPNPTTAQFVGLMSSNTLAFFNQGNLDNVTKVAVTGLQANETLLGIDLRPANGQLFGLGSTSRLYRIDPTTGAAAQAGSGTFAVPLSGTSFGIDFNPTVDRLRIVSNAGQNLRLVPDTGAVVDGDLVTAGVQGDGNLNGATASIAATAYTNSRPGAIATTEQLGINTATDQLFLQAPPNVGTQTLRGGLGVNFADNIGFDIVTSAAGINSGFATSGSSLYSINLTTGTATLIGTVRDRTTPLDLFGITGRG